MGYELLYPGDCCEPIINEQLGPGRLVTMLQNEGQYRQRYVNDDIPLIQFVENGKVLVRAHPTKVKPFALRWLELFAVVDAGGPTMYCVRRGDGSPVKYHVD